MAKMSSLFEIFFVQMCQFSLHKLGLDWKYLHKLKTADYGPTLLNFQKIAIFHGAKKYFSKMSTNS